MAPESEVEVFELGGVWYWWPLDGFGMPYQDRIHGPYSDEGEAQRSVGTSHYHERSRRDS